MWVRTIAVTALVTAVVAAQAQGEKAKDKKRPDSGRFVLTIQGVKAGTSSYHFDEDGGSEAQDVVSVGGQTQEFKVTVKAKGGKMTGFGADAGPSNHFVATVDTGKARIKINDGPEDTQSLPSTCAPFGNFSPHLMHYVLVPYDSKKGGAQPVALVLAEGLPGGQLVTLTGKLSAKGTVDKKVGDKSVAVTSYKLAVEAGGMTVDITLYADSDRYLLGWDVPSQQFTAVKEGYEEALKPAK